MPNSSIIGTNDLSIVLGISPKHVNYLTARGILKKLGRGRYNLADSVQSYLDYKTRAAEQRDATIQEAQRVLTLRKARLAELEIERTEARLIEREAVKKEMAETYRVVRDSLLLIPDRLNFLDAETRELFREEIVQILILSKEKK